MSKKPDRVREPVQAYLDDADVDLLEELSQRISAPKAEVIRRAIRRMAQDLDVASRPGASLAALTGALDADSELPTDLAARHDDYLYGDEPGRPAPRRG